MFTTLYINFSDRQGQITLELVVVSGQNEIFNICKISFNKRYLLHTYILLSTIATTQKRGRTDPGLLLGPS